MLNDELIGAFLDGELDADQRADVEDKLRRDNGAATRLRRMHAADALLKRGLAPEVQSEPDAIAAMILRGEQKRAWRNWGARVAAVAAALVLGVLIGRIVDEAAPMHAVYEIPADHARLLNTLSSGRVYESDFGIFEVVLSLQSEAGEFCRQFRLTRDQHSADVLACRHEGGAWRMVASAVAADDEAYTPAGAHSPLDVAIANLGRVEVLDVSQERAALAQNGAEAP